MRFEPGRRVDATMPDGWFPDGTPRPLLVRRGIVLDESVTGRAWFAMYLCQPFMGGAARTVVVCDWAWLDPA